MATRNRPGTHLVEVAINNLDELYENTASGPSAVPVVFNLPRSAQPLCGCRAPWLTRIPTGFYPLVSRFGKYLTQSGDDAKNDESEWEAGGRCMPPWLYVEKMITKTIIPFEVPLGNVKTKDNVTANLDVLVQFRITHGRQFIESLGAERLDLLLRAYMDEETRHMAVECNCKDLYDIQGADAKAIIQDMNGVFNPLGVMIMDFTVKKVKIPEDLVAYMQAKTGFASQRLHLEADQKLKMQGLENTMELKKIQEEGMIARLEEEEKGQKVLAAIDIDIAEIRAGSKKELALARAEYEEEVQEMLNDAQLEVQDLNNQRDSVTREVEAQTGKEKNDILADAWMYKRTQELEKVMKSAENQSQAKKVVAKAEADAAAVLEARRDHEQQMKRLDVFEALARNNNLRIASKSEVDAGANLSFSDDNFDGLVNSAVTFAKRTFNAPLQEPLMGSASRR